MATAEFSKFAGILSAALSQHHLSGFEIAQLEFYHLHYTSFITDFECYGNTGLNKDQNIALVIKRNNLKNAVYVGDTQGDYDACKKASIPFVWASYGFGKPDDENYLAKIEKFSDLLKVI